MLQQTVTEATKHDPLNNSEQHDAIAKLPIHTIFTPVHLHKVKTYTDDNTGSYLKLKECEDS